MVAAVGAETPVLDADVVVVDRDHPHRADREGVPVAPEAFRRPVVGQVEAGLVSEVALPVRDLVLVVARAGHPRPVAGGAHVVAEEARPGFHRRVADVGVAEVPVQQVEERVGGLDGIHDVAGIRGPRAEALPDGQRHRLVAEAREAELLRPSRRPGAEPASHRACSLVEHFVEVAGVGLEAVDNRVVGIDGLAGEGLGVGPLLRVDLGAEALSRTAETEAWTRDARRRGPRSRDLPGGIGPELEVELLGARGTGDGGLGEQLGPGPGAGLAAAEPRRGGHYAGHADALQEPAAGDLAVIVGLADHDFLLRAGHRYQRMVAERKRRQRSSSCRGPMTRVIRIRCAPGGRGARRLPRPLGR